MGGGGCESAGHTLLADKGVMNGAIVAGLVFSCMSTIDIMHSFRTFGSSEELNPCQNKDQNKFFEKTFDHCLFFVEETFYVLGRLAVRHPPGILRWRSRRICAPLGWEKWRLGCFSGCLPRETNQLTLEPRPTGEDDRPAVSGTAPPRALPGNGT